LTSALKFAILQLQIRYSKEKIIGQDTSLAAAYRQYLKSKRSRLYTPERGAFAVLSGEILEIVADSEALHAAILAFASGQYRLDARAATIQAIAIALGGGEMADGSDESYEDFLVEQAGLSDHPRREVFVALARKIASENDWGTRLYRFATWLMATIDEDAQ
jgi:hypothetical protein